MFKRLLFGLVVVAAVAGVVYWFYAKKNHPVVDSPFKAIPADAAVVVQVNDLSNLSLSVSQLITESPNLKQIPVLAEFTKMLTQLDSLRQLSPEIADVVSAKKHVLISGHIVENAGIGWVYYFEAPEEKQFRYVDKYAREHAGANYSTRKYENASISRVNWGADMSVSYTWAQGVFIVSQSSVLVEAALRQLQLKDNILNQRGLAEMVKMAGETSLMGIFVNISQLPNVVKQMVSPAYVDKLSFAKNIGDWVELDFNCKDQIFSFNGYTSPNTVKPGLDVLFQNQKPIHLELFSEIPQVANTFIALGISDLNKYIENYREFSGVKDDKLRTLETDFDIDLEVGFQTIFENEVAEVWANFSRDTLTTRSFTLIKINNREEAEKTLNRFIYSYARQKDLKPSEFVTQISERGGQKTQIWSLPFGNIPALLFGNLFTASDNCCATLLDNYLIFGNDPESLNLYMNQIVNKANLSNNQSFTNFSDYFASQTNFFFYNQPSISSDIYSSYLDSVTISKLGLCKAFASSVDAVVYQFNIDENKMIYNNLFIKYSSVQKEITNSDVKPVSASKSPFDWQVTLDAKPAIAPLRLDNPENKSFDLFISDVSNNIYLVSSNGNLLWKKQIDEAIVGAPVVVDAFKNGKLQILFATSNKVFLFDRKGNIVDGFPVGLKAKATAAPAVFDYDKSRNYRIFVPCSDKKLYLFDAKGQAVKGWKARKLTDLPEQPLQYFKIQDKDFIVYADALGFYAFDRKGNDIFKTSKKISPNPKFPVSLINSRSLKEARFVIVSNDSKICQISTTGKVTALDVELDSPLTWFSAFDIDLDGVKDFVTISNQTLKATDQKGHILWQTKLSSPLASMPIVYEAKDKRARFGFVTSDQKSYVFDADGKQPIGFPVSGCSTQFFSDVSDNQEKTLNLFVGTEAKTIAKYSVK